jgi:hypothetical protein
MAVIIEQAGGIASTGMFQGKIQQVLDLVPDKIHKECPINMGGKRDVQIFMTSTRSSASKPLLVHSNLEHSACSCAGSTVLPYFAQDKPLRGISPQRFFFI